MINRMMTMMRIKKMMKITMKRMEILKEMTIKMELIKAIKYKS
jgi:hypothetical protein